MAHTMGATKPSDIPQEVPMFLRKTYHMIDSCDPTIACWSDDGETFIVKDPSKFEATIIPQFFKHSKFTSFVRQLNFYSFRKIKYMDTLRLDPKLEAQTANYWRFKHDKFQRGKPNLLTQIKRMTASQSRAQAAATASTSATSNNKATPSSVKSDANSTHNSTHCDQNNEAMQSEIDILKKQLEEMNKNMNELTNMVQKVSISDPQPKDVPVGNKRKKVEIVLPPQSVSSSSVADAPAELLPDAALDLLMEANPEELFTTATDGMMDLETVSSYPMPEPLPSTRASSIASNATDSDFVDQLFSAFGQDETAVEDTAMALDALPEPTSVGSSSSSLSSQSHWNPSKKNNNNNNNRADPVLMDRLSEALAVLPKDMQEQIVNRLIDSITSNALLGPTTATQAVVVPSIKKDDDEDDLTPQAVATPANDLEALGMPLAAATLASLLSYYSNLVKDNEQQQQAVNKPVKPLPVIPCHA
ncbi:Heat stress transcription factor [Seminavis robusta]|uniref:Heat stress transcription factor n=1 Tax=Seminavis robusta TaxID=568900 RepID=A0A9N8DJA0_9STRA|nr:Heat stress transcription factor [Seminavis robusta]|eukprot:Sro183_g079680.1 Heat stress transcription factor (474) ;mRNA; f:54582-56171